MKKLLYIVLLFISNTILAQQNSDAPWMKNLEDTSGKKTLNTSNEKTSLEEVSAAFEAYWKGKDHTVKGSGYKPFKRWEYNAKSKLLSDGTVASAKYLRAENIKQHQKYANGSNVSNWTSTGRMSERTGQGRVNVIMVDPNNPNVYYVGAPAGGLWRSIDKGVSWEPL